MSHSQGVLVGLTGVIGLGVGAQCLAWAVRLPSILLLLGLGLLVGPVTGLIDPEKLMGDMLFPFVSTAVAIILFEGGMSLRFRQLENIQSALIRLLSTGALVTWILATLGAWGILRFSIPVALLIGAIMVVTGPTVVGPLLRHIRPVGRVGPIANWEGIIIDPIGAVLAVLVFQVFEPLGQAAFGSAFQGVVFGLLRTVVIGGGIGLLAAWVLVEVLKRHWIPDYLQGSVVLMTVVAANTGSNVLQAESGLLAVTLMGMALANQRSVRVKHIMELKENLQVLLISTLFILLAARVKQDQLLSLSWRSALYAAYLILLVRPLSVLISTWRTDLDWKEKAFLAWLAPRGIVAAAVASVFALQLEAQASDIVPVVLLVIIATALVYGFSSAPFARWLGLATKNPQGTLILGAHAGARAIAHGLKSAGFDVCLVDHSRGNVNTARLEGLKCYFANVLSESAVEELDLGGIGRFIALTSNDEVNSLAAEHFGDDLGRSSVYQLSNKGEDKDRHTTSTDHFRGRILFREDATYQSLDARFAAGAVVKATKLTEEHTYAAFREMYGDYALPLFVVEGARVMVCTAGLELKPKSGQTLISLVTPLGE